MGDMGVRDELKGGAGVDWCGTWFIVLEMTKGIRRAAENRRYLDL